MSSTIYPSLFPECRCSGPTASYSHCHSFSTMDLTNVNSSCLEKNPTTTNEHKLGNVEKNVKSAFGVFSTFQPLVGRCCCLFSVLFSTFLSFSLHFSDILSPLLWISEPLFHLFLSLGYNFGGCFFLILTLLLHWVHGSSFDFSSYSIHPQRFFKCSGIIT